MILVGFVGSSLNSSDNEMRESLSTLAVADSSAPDPLPIEQEEEGQRYVVHLIL